MNEDEKKEMDTSMMEPEVPMGLRPNVISHMTRHQRAKLVQRFQREKRKVSSRNWFFELESQPS